MSPQPPHADELARFVRAALAEDVGRGDVTTRAIVDPQASGGATLVFREPGVVCGLPVLEEVLRTLDPRAVVTRVVDEGAALPAAGEIARITCSMAALLTGERVALNVVGRLSGIATLTRRFAALVAGTGATLLDTRKTTPGLRLLEKYAVRAGGGSNHRMGLDDGILIKDNHIVFAGSVREAIARARRNAPPGLRVEVEVETLEQLREALAAGADMILLDNMPLALLREAVGITAGRVPLEASGGVSLESVRAIAQTGVTYVSAGALTHSARSLDVSLEVNQ